MPLTFISFHGCLSLIWLLLLVGCAGVGADPATSTPTTTVTALPTAIPATATMEIPFADNVPLVRIKNAETGTYIYEKDGQAQLEDIPASELASLWIVEDYQGSKRLQNGASSNYLSIEHGAEFVEVIPILPEWMSTRWTFEGDPSQGSVVIRNVWHHWQVLYAESGLVRYGDVSTTPDNARWFLENTDGSPFVSSTPTPTPTTVIPTASNPVGSPSAAVP